MGETIQIPCVPCCGGVNCVDCGSSCPCGAAQKFQFSVLGLAGAAPECDKMNGTWTLTIAGGGQCTWLFNTTDFTILIIKVGANWRLEFNKLGVPYARYELPDTEFSCFKSNTLIKILENTCTGWPDTITITPIPDNCPGCCCNRAFPTTLFLTVSRGAGDCTCPADPVTYDLVWDADLGLWVTDMQNMCDVSYGFYMCCSQFASCGSSIRLGVLSGDVNCAITSQNSPGCDTPQFNNMIAPIALCDCGPPFVATFSFLRNLSCGCQNPPGTTGGFWLADVTE